MKALLAKLTPRGRPNSAAYARDVDAVEGAAQARVVNSVVGGLGGGRLSGVPVSEDRLLNAVRRGDVELAKDFLMEGDEIDSLVEGRTALHEACLQGNEAMVKMLLKRKADTKIRGEMNFTALHFACMNGHTEVASLLLGKKVDADAVAEDEFALTPLHVASQNGHYSTVQLLLSNGVAVNQPQDSSQPTPLHLACKNGHTSVASALIDAGVDVNAKANLSPDAGEGVLRTAFQLACENGHVDTVQMLKSCNAIGSEEEQKVGRQLAAANRHNAVVALL